MKIQLYENNGNIREVNAENIEKLLEKLSTNQIVELFHVKKNEIGIRIVKK